MEKKVFLYEALLYPYEAGFEVYIPDLNARTQGDDLSDAAFMAQDLIKTLASQLIEDGEEPPAATFGRTAPEDGFIMVVATEAPEPEVPEMSVADAAGILGVSRARVYAMVKSGALEGRKVGQSVLVSTASVKTRQQSPRTAGRPRKQFAAQIRS